MSKLDLEIGKGVGFNDSNTYSVSLNIKNYDTSSVPLSAVRVTGYFWNQQRTFEAYSSAVNSNGTFSVINSASLPNYNGIGQYGIVEINLTDYVYRIDHGAIDSSTISPVISLIVPNGQSYISPISITNRTDNYFDVALTEIPPVTGFKISWYIPVYDETYTTVTAITAAPQIEFSNLETPFLRSLSKKADSKFTISWPTSTEIIAINYGVIGTSIKFWLNNGFSFFNGNFISDWYSEPEFQDAADSPFFVLEEFVGGTWKIVQEYNSANELDASTGTIPNVNSHVVISGSLTTSATYSVLIGEGVSNPVGSLDENVIRLKSNIGLGRGRGLIKFSTSAIPSSATDVERAILRLAVTSVSGANNYTLSDGAISVHRLTSDWNRSEATWSFRKTATPWSSQGGDFTSEKATWIGNINIANIITSSSTQNQFYVDFDVTDFVRYWRLNPSQNYGMLVKLTPQTHEDSTNYEIWNIGGVGTNLSGVRNGSPTLNIFYRSANAQGPTPTITLLNNSGSSYGTVSISAQASVIGGYISEVQVLSRDPQLAFPPEVVTTLRTSDFSFWTGTLYGISGTSEIFVRAISDLGIFGESQKITIDFLQPPEFVFTTSGDICFTNSIDIIGRFTDSVDAEFKKFELLKEMIPKGAPISDLVQDVTDPNVVWVGTLGFGIWRFDTASESWTKFNTANSNIPFDSVIRIRIESNGLLWATLIDEYQNGKGLVRFNTLNWENQNANDWYWFNQTNSPLSAFSSSHQRIDGIDIDSNDVKWIGMTWESNNNVFAISGSTFDLKNSTIYNIGYQVRSIKATPSVTYIGTPLSYIIRILPQGISTDYAGGLANVRHMEVDSFGKLWATSMNGIGEFSSDLSQYNIVNAYNTPKWPNGLSPTETPIHKLVNSYCVTMFIDSNNVKWFGFTEQDFGQLIYNGGLVKYTGDSFDISATSAASNWMVYDKSNSPGFPNNNVTRIIRDPSGRMYIGSWGGFSYLDGSVWRQYNQEDLIYTNTSSGTNFSVNWTNPSHRFEDTEFVFDINGSEVSYPVSLNLSKVPYINVVVPSNKISSVVPNVLARAAYFEIDADFAYGDDVTTTILMSSDNSNWTTFATSSSNYAEAFYNFQQGQKIFFKAVSTTQLGCSSESQTYLVFGGAAPTSTLSASSIDYSTANPMLISGVCTDLDTLDPKVLDGVTFTKSISATLLSDIGGMLTTISTLSISNGVWSYVWNEPTIGTSAINLNIADSDGHTFSTTYVLPSPIVSAPTVNMLNPSYSGLVVQRRQAIILSASAYSQSPVQTNQGISSVTFYVSASNDIKQVGSGSYVGSTWTYSTSISAISNLFNKEYYSYGIFASAVDNSGKIDTSEVAVITINTPPVFDVVGPIGNACSLTPDYLTARITESGVGVSATVYLISGTSTIVTSSSNFNGDFSWKIPSFGAYNLSAKVMDTNFIGDYSLTDISFNLGITPSANNVAYNCPLAYEKDGSLSTSKYIVSAGNVSLSAGFDNASYAMYWNAVNTNGTWTKSTFITSSTDVGTNFSVQIPVIGGSQTPIIVEAYSSEFCYASKTIMLYGIDLDASLNLGGLCNSSTVIHGSFKIDDYGPNANPNILNNVSATLKANGTSAIGVPSLNWSDSGYYLLAYNWASPIIGTSSIDLYVNVAASPQATFHYSLPINSLVIQTTATVNTGILNTSATKPNIYVNDFDGAILSAYTNAQNVSKVEYLIETKDSVYLVTGSSVAPYTAAISTPRGIINYRAKVYTKEGCEFFSAFTSILTKISPDVELTINNNACSNSSIEFVGSVKRVASKYSGSYDISAANYSIKNDNATISVKDNFGSTIFTSATSAFGSESEFGLYNVYSNPTVGTSAFVSNYTNEIFNINTQYLTPVVRSAETVGLSSPISGTTYNILSGITFSVSGVNPANPISHITYVVDGVSVHQQTTSGTGNYAFNWIPTSYGTKTVVAKTYFVNGCIVESSAVPFNVIDASVAFIVSPINGSSLLSGTTVEFVAAVNSVTNGDVSAVTLISSQGLSATMIQRSSSLWSADINVTSATSAFYVKASASYGTFQSPTNTYGIIKPLSTNVTVNTNTASVSGTFAISATSTIPNGPIVSASVFEVVNTVYNYIGEMTLSGSTYVYTLAGNKLEIGINDIVVRFVDSYNISSESVISLTVTDVVVNTYPNISYLSSDPETRMAEYGSTIESRFLMQDNIYGIDTSTIGFNSPYASLLSVTPINGNYKLEVTVAVSGSANLIVSAANNIGNYSSATVANYIFVCEGSRQLNLTNFIPNDIAYDFDRGSDSEFYTLTKFFETYLNTLYQNLEKPCSIGILDKISKLRSLHDIDSIDIAHIQYFANLMGYNVNVNLGEIGLFSQPTNTSAFVDNENFVGQLSEYQQKALRFVIRNLPNWYTIKTTRNAIRMLLLSFGIFGDIVEMYTTDYVSDWIQNIPTRDQIIDDTVTSNYWPTPHMAVYLDMNSTDRSAIYGDSSMLDALYNSIDSIRPANTVFEGLIGKYDTVLPTTYVDMTVYSEETIYVPEANRLG